MVGGTTGHELVQTPGTSDGERPSTLTRGSAPASPEGSTALPKPRLVHLGSHNSSRSRSSRSGECARLPGPRPFPSARGAPSLSLCALSSSSGRGGSLWLRPRSAGDAGATRVARADRPSPAVPLSSRLLGPLAESPASPSHCPRRPRAPEARGGPRSLGKLACGSARLTAAKLPGGGGAGPGESELRRAGAGRPLGDQWDVGAVHPLA